MPADALAALETWISQQPGYSASLASLSEFYALHPLFKTELKGRLCQVIDASPTTILAVDNSRIFQRVAILITTISDLQVRLDSVRGSPVIALDTEGFAEDGVSLLQIGWPGGLPLLIDLDAMKGEASDTTPIATSKTTISEEPSLLWCLNVLQFGEAEFADDPKRRDRM